MKQVRPEPEYFRVGFYGKGFPSSVRVRPLAKRIIWRISNEFALFHLAWRSFRCLSQCIVRGTTGTWWMFVTYFWCVVYGSTNQIISLEERGVHMTTYAGEKCQLHLQKVLIGQCKRTPSEPLSKRCQRMAMGAVEMLARVQLLSQHYLL